MLILFLPSYEYEKLNVCFSGPMIVGNQATERFNLVKASSISHIKSICVFKEVYVTKKKAQQLVVTFSYEYSHSCAFNVGNAKL